MQRYPKVQQQPRPQQKFRSIFLSLPTTHRVPFEEHPRCEFSYQMNRQTRYTDNCSRLFRSLLRHICILCRNLFLCGLQRGYLAFEFFHTYFQLLLLTRQVGIFNPSLLHSSLEDVVILLGS